MKITFLGTGTSQGVPMIGCPCEVCTSTDTKDKRLRSSVWLRTARTSIVIDTGPDFRYQALRVPIDRIDSVVYTHYHKDHIAGLDDIKAYNHWQRSAIDIYANQETQDAIKREFPYVFTAFKYPGVPQLDMHLIDNEVFTVNELAIQPIHVLHYKMDVLGFRIGDFTYITDANYISDEEMEKIKDTKYLVLNALRREKHISHFTLTEALQIIKKIGPEKAFLTHISHQLGRHEAVSLELPHNVVLAYDGLEIEVEYP